ncbi:MAG: fimbrillin family protein [Duncaniella sp.]|nr:fimbrillin family protein [Duncaniella sp.]
MGALCACTSESDTNPSEGLNACVTFTAAEVARTSLIYNSNITGDAFAVYGDMVRTDIAGATSSATFTGTKVSHNGSAWVYDDARYWIPSNTYTFAALYPFAAPGLADISYQNSTLSFTYNYPTDYTDASDLLVSAHRRIYEKSETEQAAPVAFPFSHIMARLDFVANVSPAIGNGSVTIRRITMSGVSVQGQYTITPAPVTTGNLTYDCSVSGWALTATDVTTPALFSIEPDITLPAAGSDDDRFTHRFFPLDSNPLLVIPQTLSSDVAVTIHYTVTAPGGSPQEMEATSYLRQMAVATHGGKWEAGKSYCYNFTLGADGLVIFSAPSTRPWGAAEGGNYII